MLPMAPAQAGACVSGAECDILLTNTNVLGVTVTINVHIDNSDGLNTVLTVTYLSDNITNNPLGIDQFGYNSAVAASVLPAGWSQANCPPAGCQMNGFGRFGSEIDDPGGTDLSFSFTLASLVTSFPENDRGAEFAAHIRYDGGCSAFVSDGTSATPGLSTSCIRDQQLPEPATLLLLAVGLFGLGIARRVSTAR